MYMYRHTHTTHIRTIYILIHTQIHIPSQEECTEEHAIQSRSYYVPYGSCVAETAFYVTFSTCTEAEQCAFHAEARADSPAEPAGELFFLYVQRTPM
jgi:hypothetical protein